jgi:hypothetical protein
VSWGHCRDSQPPVTCYHLSAAEADEAETDDAGAHVCYSGAATSTEIRNLVPGVNYRLRVCAENEVGQGPWSPAAICFQKSAEKRALKSAPAPPAAPVNVALEKATRTSLRVSWQAAAAANSSSAPGARASRRTAALENGKETYGVEVAEGNGEFAPVGEELVETRVVVSKLKPGTRSVSCHEQREGREGGEGEEGGEGGEGRGRGDWWREGWEDRGERGRETTSCESRLLDLCPRGSL